MPWDEPLRLMELDEDMAPILAKVMNENASRFPIFKRHPITRQFYAEMPDGTPYIKEQS